MTEDYAPDVIAASAAMASQPSALPRRFIVAATIGNALEFYDFITYAFFAIQIGHAFFPSHNAYGSLMLSLATFGVGFVTRPIGGVIIGAYSDRAGRRPAMMLSFTMMGVAIIALALIPPYAKIGIAAPILAVLARMLQGFSLGGEVGPTTAYLLEAAPLKGRIAATLGGLVGVGLSLVMAPAALDAYGWRIAFLLGAVTLPYGLWIRRGLQETLHAPEPTPVATARQGALALLGANGRIISLALLVLAGGTIATYVLNYMTTFAQATLHMKPGISFLGNAMGNVSGIAAVLFGGWLSDRHGRRPVMIWSNLAYLLLILPIFYWIVEARSALALIAGLTALGIASTLSSGAFYAAVTETLPKRICGRTFATVYATAIALFGGTTQLVITWLIKTTGSPMAPAFYLLGATIIGQMAIRLILESAPAKTGVVAPA